MLVFFVLLGLGIAAFNDENATYSISGEGSLASAPMIKQWAFSYSILKPSVAINFGPVNSEVAFESLKAQCRSGYQTDFIISDLNWKLVKQDVNDILVIPYFATAVVMSYNFPNISSELRLSLSRELLWQIWSENVTMWNDTLIKQENQNLASLLPNQRIRLIYRSDPSAMTTTLVSLLTNVDKTKSSETRKNFTQYYNWRGINFSNYSVPTKSNFAMASGILTTEWSLGYVALSYADQAGLSYAKLTNAWGEQIEPTDDAMAVSMSNALALPSVLGNVLKVGVVQLADPNVTGAYPLTSLYYIAVHQSVDSDCDQRNEVLKFHNWILSSTAADEQIRATTGYSSFDKPSRDIILAVLKGTTCQGKKNLQVTFDESESTPLRQAAMSLAAILLTVVLIVGIALGLKRTNRVTKAAGLAFAICFLLGTALNYIGVFVWAIIPDKDSICAARYILVAVGYSLILGSMFAKCWEVKKIFSQGPMDVSPFQEFHWWKFCQVFGAVVGVNLILLLALGVADPPTSSFNIINDVDLTAMHVCSVNNINVWAGLEFAFFGSLLLWGGYLAYVTRGIWEKYNYPNESQSILLSIYNIIFCCLVLLPLMQVLRDEPEVVFFFVATAILFPTSFALFTVHGPKIVSFLGSSWRKGDSGMTKTAGQSGGLKSPDGALVVRVGGSQAISRDRNHLEEPRRTKTHAVDDEKGGGVSDTEVEEPLASPTIESSPLSGRYRGLTAETAGTPSEGSNYTTSTKSEKDKFVFQKQDLPK